MAAVNDCFTIGSIVLCTTCFNQEVEGEVLAFDHHTKMLILKCRSGNPNTDLNDVYALNLSFCSNVQVIKEVHTTVEGPQKLNIEQLKIRLRNTVDERQRWVKSINADVSPEAQELYRMIAKHYKSQEVTWHGKNINIFDEVTIQPPYGVNNVNGRNQNFCSYIRKMVDKFYQTQAAQAKSNAGQGASPLSSASASPSSAPSQSVGSSSNNVSSASPVPAN